MIDYEFETVNEGRIGFLERAIRGGVGLAVIMAALHLSIENVVAYPYLMLFATLVVLSAIVGWDPIYALARRMAGSMKQIESLSFSSGNIAMPDRVMRVVLGSAVLIYSLEVEIGGVEAYPFVKLFASLVVLTGIAGWDPFYSAFRSVIMRFSQYKPRHRWLTTRYS